MTIAEALRGYRAEHSSYPVAMGIEELRPFLEPKYVKLVPSWAIQYHSDGAHYDLIFLGQPDGEVTRCSLCQFRIKDGVWVSWPSGMILPTLQNNGAS